jgi:hypothetical protein
VAHHGAQRRFHTFSWTDAGICSVTGNAKGYHHTMTLKKGTVKKIGLVVEVFDSIMESKSTEQESSSSSEGKNISFESI